ncbi:MAG: sigma-70 family RNA polymerase sigma factor [Firmicutes bacterium]|nr:sigma-70 family RNA polymerase sigma factor [Bacillota bacterium]
MSYVHDRGIAQDLAQEVFVRLEQWHRQHPDASVHGGWLYTTARHLIIDHQRQVRRSQGEVAWNEQTMGHTSMMPSFEDQIATRITIQQAIDRLAPKDRECLWLFYYQELSVDTIAQQLGVSPGNVRTRLLRARRRLAKLLGR